MLTKRQRDVMLFLQDTFDETGIIPTQDEMMAALNLNSKNQTYRALKALGEKGFIKTLPRRTRAIDIIRRVDRTPAELAVLEAQKNEAAL
ncbi:hypothetical protein J7382_08515 [Shimia sp. R11_0]|uniref:LexA family protein n=1 Tax=Shimia sp. R11_0 TaxID=2821096 RepID=UPI001AD9771C|nr:hypothetical protein [Shimia sp. R11_0]MBO9477572.1 hypothetical protein [Shimia sp. R11_0]